MAFKRGAAATAVLSVAVRNMAHVMHKGRPTTHRARIALRYVVGAALFVSHVFRFWSHVDPHVLGTAKQIERVGFGKAGRFRHGFVFFQTGFGQFASQALSCRQDVR